MNTMNRDASNLQKDMDLDQLVEKGRALHSQAVYGAVAGAFRWMASFAGRSDHATTETDSDLVERPAHH